MTFSGRQFRTTIFLALLVGGVAAVPAQILGPEFRVNSYTTDVQWYPAVAADGAGNFVVAWMSDEQDGHSWGIFGQRYDAAGLPLGDEFQVNSSTSAHQMGAAAAVDGAGNFVVTWYGYRTNAMEDVFGQRFAAGGLPLGSEFRVNTYTTFRQFGGPVAANAAGEFVVVWTYSDPAQRTGVFGQRFDAAGQPVGGEVTIAPIGGPAVAAGGLALRDDGEFVVAWTSCTYVDPWDDDCDVAAQRFDAGGPVGGQFQVNTFTDADQAGGSLAADSAGNFVIVWQSFEQDGSSGGIFGQRFDAAAAPRGGEFQVNSYTPGWQWSAAVAADGRGNFLVVWHSEGQDGSGRGVFGQLFSASGARVGGEFQVNSYTTGDQQSPSVAAGAPGNFVVAWHSDGQDGSNRGVFARRVTTGVFLDGFEGGDACGWSRTVGGGCP